jgi:hypothetical protein
MMVGECGRGCEEGGGWYLSRTESVLLAQAQHWQVTGTTRRYSYRTSSILPAIIDSVFVIYHRLHHTR